MPAGRRCAPRANGGAWAGTAADDERAGTGGALPGAGAGPDAAPPTFRIEAEAVELDVSVTLGDRPVTGLTAADFVVRDSGVVQDVELATAGSLP